MSASNRASLISKLHTALKKHYKAPPPQPARPLLEYALYASVLEDCPADLADEALAKCEQEFFDWNEVRVTTATELSQVFARLPDPAKAAQRLKGNLQAIFEEFYTFDLDHLKKENLGKAVSKFENMPGMTRFVLSYTVQHGLGGHSIPIDYSAMVVMLVLGIASQGEASSGRVPGLERAIPKNKGVEFGSLLHQAAVALNQDPDDKTGRLVLESVVKGSSDGLDDWLKSKAAAKKRVARRRADEKAAKQREAEEGTDEKSAAPKKTASKKPTSKKSGPAKTAPEKAAPNKTSGFKKTGTAKPKTSAAETEPPPSKPASDPKKGATKKSATKSARPSKKKSKQPSADAAPKTVDRSPKTKSKKSSEKSTSASGPAKGKSGTAKPKPENAKPTSDKKSTNRKLTKRKPR